MAEALKRSDPTGVIAAGMLGVGTGTLLPHRVEKKALSFTGTANGGCLSWQNPENQEILATVLVRVTTAGTGTAGIDLGVGGNGTASSDNILDAARVDTVDFVRNPDDDKGTNGRAWRLMDEKDGTNDYLVAKANDLDTTAAGFVYIMYIPVL